MSNAGFCKNIFAILIFKYKQQIDLDYLDVDLFKNKISISRKNKDYYLVSKSLNVSKIIDDLLKTETKSKNNKNLPSNFKLDIKINETFLDKDHAIENLNGYLSFKNGEIIEANLDSSFTKNKKIRAPPVHRWSWLGCLKKDFHIVSKSAL